MRGAVLEVISTMNVRDIMTTDVVAVPPTLAAELALKQMRMARVHHLVVIDAEHIVGVLSDRDLAGGCAGKNVADVMASHVVVVDADSHIRHAAKLMHAYRIGCLPVVDGKQLVGILTTSDVLAFVSRTDFAPATRTAGPAAIGGNKRGPGTART